MSESFITRVCYSPKSHDEILKQVERHGVSVLCRDVNMARCKESKSCKQVFAKKEKSERAYQDCRQVQVMVQVDS